MTDRYRYESSSSLSDLGDRIRSRQTSYRSPSTSSSRYYNPPPTYSPFGSSSRDPRTTRPEISSYFTDNEVVSGNVRVPRRDLGPSSDLGARIRSTVADRQGRGYGSYTPPGYEDVRNRVSGAPNHRDIFDSVRSRVNPDVMTGLGDMIRNRAQGGATSQLGGIPGIAPTQRPEPPNLPNLGNAFDMGQSIRDRVMGGIGGRQQPSIPNDPRNLGVPQQSGDGAWGVDQGSYEEGGYTPATDLAPGQGQAPPPVAPTDPGAAPGGSMAPVDPGSGGWTVGTPQGAIPGGLQIAYGRGGTWDAVNQYDEAFEHYGNLSGVDPNFLKAMAVVESGGQMIPNANGFPNYGIMQLTYSTDGQGETKWERVGRELGVDFYSPEGQIAIAAYVLGGHDGDAGSPEDIFLSTYYPTPCLTCPGQDGHTPQQYLDDLAILQSALRAAGGGQAAAPIDDGMGGGVIDPLTGQPYQIEGGLAGAPVGGAGEAIGGGVAPGDAVAAMTGGAVTSDSIGYGFGSDACPVCIEKCYYCDYGDWDYTKHPGDDVPLPYNTPIGSPVSGVVTCGGTGNGTGSWDSGCSAFGDSNGMGTGNTPNSGRIEVLDEATGISWIMGHSAEVYVEPGQYVNVGDIVGTSGWKDDPHTHLEARVWCPELSSTGWKLVDPALAAKSTNGRADFCVA